MILLTSTIELINEIQIANSGASVAISRSLVHIDVIWLPLSDTGSTVGLQLFSANIQRSEELGRGSGGREREI